MIGINFVPGFSLGKINVNQQIVKWNSVRLAVRKHNRKVMSLVKNRTKNASFKKMRN